MPKSNFINMKGKIFGKLKVIRRVENNKRGIAVWACMCSCKNKTLVYVNGVSLRNGNTKSCGCLQKERTRERHIKHGKTNTKTYYIWYTMKKRCENENHISYKYYGARGIKICNRWSNSFKNFLEDMGECPFGHSLDRIDNSKNYKPNNCKWSTRYAQNRNRISNIFIKYKGEELCFKDWAKRYKINYNTAFTRYYRGWSFKEIMEIIPRIKNRRKLCSGKKKKKI